MYNAKIKNFTDLNSWKEAYKLVLLVYQITDTFPSKEQFCLTSQMRRAVVSGASNIAEGFSRNSTKEKIQFYHTAQGSITELQNQIIIARGLKYITKSDFDKLFKQSVIVHKLINGMIKSLNKTHRSHYT